MDTHIKDDLEAERKRVNSWLMEKRALKFPGMGDLRFEEKSKVGRGQIPAIRNGSAFPKLDVLYLWTHACGRTLKDLFHGNESFIDPKNVRTHEKLEFLIEQLGPKNWLVDAIESAFKEHAPQVHGKVKRIPGISDDQLDQAHSKKKTRSA